MIAGEALWWVPSAAALAMSLLALFAAMAQPRRPARSAWMLAILICGVAAVAVSASQQAANRAALGQQTAQLRELWSRLDELGRSLPAGAGKTPAETFDTATAAIRALTARIEDLDEQIQALQQKSRTRNIDPQTVAQIAQYLRRFEAHRVIISCVPDDFEAFAYANRIAVMLRAAGWEALGPEKTTIFGDAPAMAVKLYVRNAAAPPDAAKLLIEAFTRFNIPYQSGVAPSDAIPDPATVELFVSRKS